MEDYQTRPFTWEDVERVAGKTQGWKGIPPGGCAPAMFLHQFGDLALKLENPEGAICGVVACTIAPSFRGNAMIQTLLVDGALLGTGAVKFFLGRLCGAAKELGCDKLFAAVPHKSQTFLSLFMLSDFAPVEPPSEMLAGGNFHPDGGGGKSKPETGGLHQHLWKDYFGAGEHAVVLIRDI